MTAVLEQNTLIGRENGRPEEEKEGIHDVITSVSYLDTSIPGYNDPITFPKDPTDRTGATFVHFFDYAARGPVGGNPEDPTINDPVKSVHCDQSYDGARKVVMSRIEDKVFAEEVAASRRFQIINAWRPLKPVFKDPFAVTDARSVPDSDMVGLPVRAGDYMDESWAARPNHAHRWYYKFAQKPDEVLIFKCFDSVDDGKTARRVLHSAFTDPAQEHMAPRESFEARATVVY
ncbi:hypothetical protein CSOJ01_14304 [Colletotrichum sojae]|uniref:Methyltransferase n=1 Tax=Colletotrichum sojae TaxID=2175907 RepID=A0A8H6IR68_9PEZI|nr:hypothetical protein CSOJ01_14304 [Colletotrichum sojae]